MSEIKKGDRVKVVGDIFGERTFVGREGVVTKQPRYVDGVLRADPAVRLDGRGPRVLQELHFAPEELELLDADVAAHDPAVCGPCDDHADATVQADRDETALDGAL